MQHHAAFHQGLHFLLRLKQSSAPDIHHNLEKSTFDPLKCIMHYGQSRTYCINMYGKTDRKTKLIRATKMCPTQARFIIEHIFITNQQKKLHCTQHF